MVFSGASLAWMAFIFQVSSYSPQEITDNLGSAIWLGPYRDIVGHLVLYGALGLLLQICIWSWRSSIDWSLRWAVAATAIALLYGISDEYHQSLVPGRAATLLDVGVDTAGAVSAVVAVTILGHLALRR